MTGAAGPHWLGALLGDADAARIFSVEAELTDMLAFESALAVADAEAGLIPAEAGAAIAAACDAFAPDHAALAAGTARDGVVVPELVRQLRVAVGEPHAAHVHHGATSQDVVDTALALRVREIVALFGTRLGAVLDAGRALAARDGGKTVMGITRLQPALPIRAAHRIANWTAPVERARQTLPELAARLSVIQLGGPLGDRATFGGRGGEVAARIAQLLGLGDPGAAWHTDRSRVAELGGWAARLTGGLGKIGADVALGALTGAVRLQTGGGSSAMPHKTNPVGAEVLVTLAAFNAAQVSALHTALVHENERSGAAWTLEWMVLPPMLTATLAALRHAEAVLGGIEFVATGEAGGG
ncbi:MAG TPA: 3-carboxy-cis,cis-muconate cycloisomerase [Devosiaceae bacterium]|nr:3-carboxy-cis,cis-muconate cycloisomerase [Devosiaceae bacterium]